MQFHKKKKFERNGRTSRIRKKNTSKNPKALHLLYYIHIYNCTIVNQIIIIAYYFWLTMINILNKINYNYYMN